MRTSPADGRISRRKVLQYTGANLVGLSLLGATACDRGGGSGDAKTSFQVWTSTVPEKVEFMKRTASAWNEGRNVTAKPALVPAGNSTEEVVLAAIAAGNPPDVLANAAPNTTPQYDQGKALLNLSDEFDAAEFVRQRSGEEVLKAHQSPDDGGLYQIPWFADPVMVFYNKSLFEKAGLDPEKPPATYGEYLAAMARLDRAGITPVAQGTDQTWWHRYFDWYPLYLAAARKPLLDENASQPVYDGEAGVAATEFWREVYAKGFAPKGAPSVAEVQNVRYFKGRAAMLIWDPSILTRIPKKIRDVTGVTAVPVPDAQKGEPAYTFGNSRSIVVFTKTSHKSDVWEFVKEITAPDSDEQYLRKVRDVPLRASLLGRKPSGEGDPLLVPFIEQTKRLVYADATPKFIDMMTDISKTYLSACVHGKSEVRTALQDSAERVAKILGKS